MRSRLLVGLACAVVLAAAAYLWFARPDAPAPSPAESALEAGPPAAAPPTGDGRDSRESDRVRVEGKPSPRSVALSAALEAGRLPEPLALPRGRVDRQAAELARTFVAGGDDAIAALHAATLASGFVIRQADGSVTQPAHSQGIGLEWWEVAALARLEGRGYGVTLGHLADAIRMAVPGATAPIDTAVRDGLQAALRSPHPGLQFWARFIIELGYLAREPYELPGGGDLRSARLDPVQMVFLLSRLAGDAAAASGQGRGSARWSAPAPGLFPVVHAQTPCSTEGWMSVFADWSALASTTVFGQVVGDFQTLSKALGLLNAFGALTKFVLSYAFLDAKIEMDAEELIRTKDTSPGDYRLLTARVTIDADRTQYLNCLRRILNQSGLDLNLPESGPVANARVSWSRPAGGAVIHRDGDPGSWWVEDELAWFDALDGNDPSPLNQFTDEAGESRIDFVGNPQRFDLSPYRLTEVNKDTVVQVNVALKGRLKRNEDGSISGAGVASEATDLLGAALAFLTGDPVGGAVSAVTETAFRTSWYASDGLRFTVKDWEICTSVWQGVITYASQRFKASSGAAGNSTGSSRESWKYTATVTAKAYRDKSAEGQVAASASREFERYGTGLRGCYYETRRKRTVSGSANEQARVRVSTAGDRYSISYSMPMVEATGTHEESSEIKGQCNNPYNKNSHRTEPAEEDLSPGLPVLIEGRIDPANPNVLRGSESVTTPTSGGAASARVSWSFVRCPE